MKAATEDFEILLRITGRVSGHQVIPEPAVHFSPICLLSEFKPLSLPCKELIKLGGLVIFRVRDPLTTLSCMSPVSQIFKPQEHLGYERKCPGWNQKTLILALDLPPLAVWP